MARYIRPEPPFTLDRVEMTQHPARTVRVHRIAAALQILGMSALIGATAATGTTLIHTLSSKAQTWHEMVSWWRPALAFLVLVPVVLYAWRWDRIKAGWLFRGYHLGDEELYIRSGLLYRRFTVLAYARIQEVNVVSGPIQRRYDLATVTISSAAGHNAIADVDPQTAYELRDRLTDLARKRRLPV
ncbi:MAG TPA: PH domain-containing protein [Streptomyces sp.]|uniref:PH domain-containing protein n=1 Tax=Streptomyces sp. TaxID=1931 RepID=UPI002C5DFD8C|nr:PH domain-containing protein [Streptomyces sp.]HWU10701.1 PH domain-containing protein [Streptomyces sp.]